MTNKGICEIPLFDPMLPKIARPSFEVTSVCTFPDIGSKLVFSKKWSTNFARIFRASRVHVKLNNLDQNCRKFILEKGLSK